MFDLSSEEAKLGRFAERLIAAALKELTSFALIDSNDLDNNEPGAPMVLNAEVDGCRMRLIKPDLDLAHKGLRFWCECKGRRTCGDLKIMSCETQMISKRQWRHYQLVQDVTGTQVWIFLFQRDAHELLVSPLSRLDLPQNKLDGIGEFKDQDRRKDRPQDYWFFRRSAFDGWASYYGEYNIDTLELYPDEIEPQKQDGWLEMRMREEQEAMWRSQ